MKRRIEANADKTTPEKLLNLAKLESLIAQEADYEKILKQSQRIDKYIVEEMKRINNKEKVK